MEQAISINPDSLKSFTKHLCIIAKKHSDREAAHEDLDNQLSRIRRLSISKKATKNSLKNEIKKLENKISLVLQKEAELFRVGKVENLLIQKLKDRVEELEQLRKKELSKKNAELSSIHLTLRDLEKKQDYLINTKAQRGPHVKELETKKRTQPAKEQIRERIHGLEAQYNSLKGKYDQEALAIIADKIDELKQRI